MRIRGRAREGVRAALVAALVAVPAAMAAPAPGRSPIYFVQNLGQSDLPCSWYALGGDRIPLFGPSGVTFVMRSVEAGPDPESEASPDLIELQFVGARPGVEPVGEAPSGARFSWFRGRREQWRTGLPMCTRLVYRELWPGIDLVYSSEDGRLKYSFVLRPGADPQAIQLAYPKGTLVAVDGGGGAAIMTRAGLLEESRPCAFQVKDARTIEVPVSFAVRADAPNRIAFQVGARDAGRELVIDPPTFVYAGFLGGIDYDRGLGIAVDAAGATYFTGQVNTFRGEIDERSGVAFSYDAFVAKLDPSGTALEWLSVLSGSREDEGFDIAVDAAGSAYVAGMTMSADYPAVKGPDLTHHGEADVLVTKLSPDGTDLVWSGFLGGAANDYAEGVVVDREGNAFVEGLTASDEKTFPVTVGPALAYCGGVYDTFIAKVRAVPDKPDVKQNLWYCGYIGGAGDDSGWEGATDGHVAIDASGAAYVSGMTTSDEKTFPTGRGFGDLPGFDRTHDGDLDAYIVKVAPDGSRLAYATYIGGAEEDAAFGMSVDAQGNAYVTGCTKSDEKTFPVTVGPDLTFNGGDEQGGDAFVVKLDPSGTKLAYCGYVGGADVEKGESVLVDATGALYVAGYTESSEATFPARGGPDTTFNGAGKNIGDGFVCKVRPVPSDPVPANNYEWCSYVGGDANDSVYWIALDPAGGVHVVGDAASTEATFPDGHGLGSLPGWNRRHAGIYDAFVVKIAP